jgi:camphor 5-monooxygenase
VTQAATLSPAVDRPDHIPADRVVDFDIYAPPNGRENYHLAWKALQDSGVPEIIWTPRNGGHWMVTSGRLISHIFADYKRFSSRVLFVPKEDGQHHQLPPSTIDPPTHRPYRALLTNGLSPRGVSGIEAGIRTLAIELIEGFRETGRCSFTTDYAEQLPVRIFMDMVDLPIADAPKIKYWVDQTTRPDGSMSYEEAIRSLVNYMAPVTEQRRGGTGTDLITGIVNGRVGDRPLTPKEAAELCAQVLVGGVDTVVNMLSFIMLHFATHPASARELVEDPSLIDIAVEEMLRRHPIISDGREIADDMEFEGVVMKKGEMVVLPTVLHGLDDRENPDPLKVDFHRPTANHSTFGQGAHKCPGAHLARVEIRITLEEWFKRIPVFSVDPAAEITYTCGVVGCVDRVPLVWEPATTHKID